MEVKLDDNQPVSNVTIKDNRYKKTDINTFMFTLTLGLSVFFFVIFCLFNCYRAKRGDKVKVTHVKHKHRHRKTTMELTRKQ